MVVALVVEVWALVQCSNFCFLNTSITGAPFGISIRHFSPHPRASADLKMTVWEFTNLYQVVDLIKVFDIIKIKNKHFRWKKLIFKFFGERKWIIFEIGDCSICTRVVETEALFCTFDYSILWRMLNFIWKVVHRTFGFLFESTRPVPVKVICHVKKCRTVSTLRIFEAFVNFHLRFNVVFKTILNNYPKVRAYNHPLLE